MSASDQIIFAIGKIITNIQSLEFVLRLFLYETVGPKDPLIQFGKLSVGDKVPETPITNYDSLNNLIKKVNEQLQILGINDQIDKTLVDLRDSIAHGRAMSSDPNGISRLFKFSKPSRGFVEVDTSVDLTQKWLSDQVTHIFGEIQKVIHISRGLGLSCFPK